MPGDRGATFSKSMLTSSLDSPAATFQVFIDANSNSIYDAGDTLVNGTVAYDDGTKTPSPRHRPR